MRRNDLDARDRRRTRLVSGATLVGLALSVSGIGLAPAAAQDAGADPDAEADAAPADDEGQPLEIPESALYVSPVTDALPPTLTSSVPPAAVCVIMPELCPDSLDPVRSVVTGAIAAVQDQGRDLPVQPVPEGNAAVSFLGGVTRYQTAIKFDAPVVPEGEEIMAFELVFPQSQPTYDVSSPTFRRAVLGVFEFIGAQDPAKLGEGLAAALTEEELIDTSKLLALEACPLLEPFEPAGAPMASDASELPQQEVDGEEVPAIDCTFGGNGVYDEEAEVWRVDLAFAAQAWADGEIDNHGILLRPIGAPNLAFGDADTTTNAQLTLDITEVTASMESMEAFDPGDFEEFDEPAAAGGEDLGAGGGDLGGDAGGFDDTGSDDDFGASLGEEPAFPEGEDAGFDAEAPEVADGLEADGEEDVALDAQAANPAGTEPTTPWWVWLVAPLLLGGAYLTGSAVLAPAAVAGGSAGGGALTRMLEKRAGTGTSPTLI